MSTVFFKDVVIDVPKLGKIPLLVIDYGIVEIGGGPEDVSLIRMIDRIMREAGMRPFGETSELPQTDRVMRVEGTTGKVEWDVKHHGADEYEELDEDWIRAADGNGGFFAVYRNLCPHKILDLHELLKAEGTLCGWVGIAVQELDSSAAHAEQA